MLVSGLAGTGTRYGDRYHGARIEDPEAPSSCSLFPGNYAAQAAAYYALRRESDALSSFPTVS
jgi:hypothetical protein